MPIWLIITAISALFGIGGTAYGADQHQKRKEEQAAFRARLQELEKEINAQVIQLTLRRRLGEKNAQVLALAKEVERLRSQMEKMRRAA